MSNEAKRSAAKRLLQELTERISLKLATKENWRRVEAIEVIEDISEGLQREVDVILQLA